jgi:hypothetical protein
MKKINCIDDFKFNLNLLLLEYNTHISNLIKDVTNQGNQTLVQKRFHLITQNKINPIFDKLDYTKSIVESVQEFFKCSEVVYRVLMPNTAYNWHRDLGKFCYHIPLTTNSGSRFVYEDDVFHMPVGYLYSVDNSVMHTFVNAGQTPRIHMTFENLEEPTLGPVVVNG